MMNYILKHKMSLLPIGNDFIDQGLNQELEIRFYEMITREKQHMT